MGLHWQRKVLRSQTVIPLLRRGGILQSKMTGWSGSKYDSARTTRKIATLLAIYIFLAFGYNSRLCPTLIPLKLEEWIECWSASNTYNALLMTEDEIDFHIFLKHASKTKPSSN
jgi:hypothetical protein